MDTSYMDTFSTNIKDKKEEISSFSATVCCCILSITSTFIAMALCGILTYISYFPIYKHLNYLPTRATITTVEHNVRICGKSRCQDCITFNVYSKYMAGTVSYDSLNYIQNVCDSYLLESTRSCYKTNNTINYYYDPKNPYNGDFTIEFTGDQIFLIVVMVITYLITFLLSICVCCVCIIGSVILLCVITFKSRRIKNNVQLEQI